MYPSAFSQAGLRRLKYPSEPAIQSKSSERVKYLSASSRACLRSVMSLKTRMTPSSAPWFVTMGAALSSISNSLPFLEISSVWSARPTTFPSRKTFFTGVSTGRRVSLFTMSKTKSIDLPRASSIFQPVSDWAIEFMNVTAPFVSAAITASPMLPRVVENHFSLFSRAVCARLRSDSSRSSSLKHNARSRILRSAPAKMI